MLAVSLADHRLGEKVADPRRPEVAIDSGVCGEVAEWQEMFREHVRGVRRSGLVKELYLIGSRARNEHSSSSSFDLLAVVSREADPWRWRKAQATEEDEFSP